MVDVKTLVYNTLSSVGVPVKHLRHKSDSVPYITYRRILAKQSNFADDTGIAKEHYFRADIYAKTDVDEIAEKVEEILEQSGFYGISSDSDDYENDTGLFHIPVEFYYVEEKECAQ